MFSTESIERKHEPAEDSLFRKRMLEPADLPLRATYYPLGFPAEVRTNSEQVLEQFAQLWGMFGKLRDTEPIRCEVQCVEDSAWECPPDPIYRLMLPLVTSIANAENYCIADLERAEAKICVSRGALLHPAYARYFLLGVPACCIATCRATPVHCGCVSLHGRGILLCGDSGAGKSTLAYACARSGFAYTSDDGTYILDGGANRLVTGNCYQVRFRPTAAKLFHELRECKVTPRAAGKPSIELPTSPMAHIACAQTARVEHIVFLHRNAAGPAKLAPFARGLAREWMRQVLYGPAESLARQYQSIEKLLDAEVLELRYTDLDSAVHSLRSLAGEN